MKPAILITSLMTLLALFASTQVNAATASRQTRDFVYNAANANQFEIELGELALRRAHSNTVRRFAQRMIDDHSQANQKMRLTLREERLRGLMPRDLDRRHQRIIDRLRSDRMYNFDREYIDIVKDEKDKEVFLFRDYSRHGDNDRLQAFASRMRSILRDHERIVNDIQRDYRRSDRFSRRQGYDSIEPSAGGDVNRNWDRNYQSFPDRSYRGMGPYRSE